MTWVALSCKKAVVAGLQGSPDSGAQPKNVSGVLTGWKAISAFLGVSVRAAQLWEKEKGLPVVRIKGGARPGVAADPEALRQWLIGTTTSEKSDQGTRKSRMRAWLGPSAALLAALVIVALLAQSWDGTLGVPVRVLHDGKRIRTLDRWGGTIWERESPPWLPAERPGAEPKEYPALFGDFDGDGSVETILSLIRPNSNRGGQIECVEADGSTLWTFAPGAPVTWNGRHFYPCYFSETPMFLVRSEGQRGLIVPSRHCTFFPAQISLLDPADGRLIGQYWHPGNITASLLVDLDEDGKDEILLAGFNNPGLEGNGHAGLALIEPADLQAAAFDPDDPFGFERSAAREYLLFANPDVAGGAACLVRSLAYDRPGRIEVHVTGPDDRGELLFTLDRKLDLVEVAASNHFLSLHEEMFRQGQLDHRFDADRLRQYGRIYRVQGRNANGNAAAVREFFESSEDSRTQ